MSSTATLRVIASGKPFPARARSSRCHTRETRHSDTSLRSERSLPSRKLNGANVAASVLAIACDVLPGFKTRQSGQSLDHLVRAAPPELTRQTQPRCMHVWTGHHRPRTCQHLSRVLQSSDFPSRQFLVLRSVLNPQELHLDMSGFVF